MLKTRVIPTLLYKDVGLVKGIKFDSWRRTGGLMQAIKVYNMREVDELIFLDIQATNKKIEPDYNLVKEFAYECFVPLTVGGGIASVEHVRKLLKSGADKVSLNTAAVLNPELIRNVAREFGSQCVVLSIDVQKNDKGFYEVYTHAGKQPTGVIAQEWAKMGEELGAGEILITSIERDGTMQGYDLELLSSISKAVQIPVIAAGGAGNYQHMLDAIQQGKVNAVAAASIFHFTEQTPMEAKKFLFQNQIQVRI